MKEELKKRIQALHSGVIPEGYVETPIGPLPANWRYARLGDIAEELTETAGNGTYETVSISAGVGFVNQAEKFGKEMSGKQYEKYIVLHKGDFSYNKGNSNRYPQGCIYRLNDRETAAVPNVFESFRIVDGCPEYYEQLFISGFLNRQLYRLINHGVRDDGLLNLTGKDFYSCLLPVPPIEEQKKIVSILKASDSAIELYRAKENQYQDLKKACMELLFPKLGCPLPKLRFSGFADDWEQRKLGELTQINGRIGFRGYTQKDIITKDAGGILTFSPTNIIDNRLSVSVKNTYITQAKYDESPEIKISNDDILFVKTGSTLGKSALVSGLSEPATINPQIVVIRIRPELARFLSAQLITDNVQKQVAAVKIGGAVPTMTETQLKAFNISVPVNSSEAEAIGDFFVSLDHLITLHQRMLEEYRLVKAAMMNLLLVGAIRVL